MKHFYLILTVVGTLIPYAAFFPFLIENGLDLTLLWQEMFASAVSSFFALDVIVSALILAFLVWYERERLGRLWYLPIVGTFLVGVSCGLPLYLYLREEE